MTTQTTQRLLVTALLLVSLLASLAGRAQGISQGEADKAYAPRRLGLTVGINEFQDPNWRTLQFAVADARAMAADLADPAVGRFDEVETLAETKQTTADGVRAALRRLENKNTSPDDLVFIYISTHGTLDRDGSGDLRQYLVASNTSFTAIPKTAISHDEIFAFFQRLKSRRKVLVLAACHSGQGKSELPPAVRDEIARTKGGFLVEPIEDVSEASVIIGVCAFGETAQENPALGHDIYTYFLLEAMRSEKADRDQDGAISLSEAHDYARRSTYYFTEGKQRPFARSDILGSDPILLAGRVKGGRKPVVYGYGDYLGGSVLNVDGQDKGALPDGYAVEKGWINLKVYFPDSDKTVFKGPLYVREGQRIDIDRMVDARSEPPFGAALGYRAVADSSLAHDVFPSAPLYGLAYNLAAFPFADSALRFEAAYHEAHWTAGLDTGREADISGRALSLAIALLFSRPTDRAEYFAGPLLGGFFLEKDIQTGKDEYSRAASTFYPGVLLGARLHLDSDLDLELSYRGSYQAFNVNDDLEASWVNEISLTAFLPNPGRWTR
jgi:hypothetical protein